MGWLVVGENLDIVCGWFVVGMGLVEWDGVAIIGRRKSKSSFSANN